VYIFRPFSSFVNAVNSSALEEGGRGNNNNNNKRRLGKNNEKKTKGQSNMHGWKRRKNIDRLNSGADVRDRLVF
jgi:hypothetical protein